MYVGDLYKQFNYLIINRIKGITSDNGQIFTITNTTNKIFRI